MSRLSIEITGQQHQQIKAMAALRGMSIKDYILEATVARAREKSLEEELQTDNEKAAFAELMAVLAPSIAAAERGELSNRTIDDIISDSRKRYKKK